jgi:hypothetical protein
LGEGYLNPGIYCIHGDIDASGSETIVANSGVVLYFIDGRLDFSGQANLDLDAPNGSSCLGSVGNRYDSCNYVGVAIFSARANTSVHSLNGNGDYKIDGLVYAIKGGIIAGGGGTEPDEYVIKGQVIASQVLGNGNGTFSVTYSAGDTVTDKTRIALHK